MYYLFFTGALLYCTFLIDTRSSRCCHIWPYTCWQRLYHGNISLTLFIRIGSSRRYSWKPLTSEFREAVTSLKFRTVWRIWLVFSLWVLSAVVEVASTRYVELCYASTVIERLLSHGGCQSACRDPSMTHPPGGSHVLQTIYQVIICIETRRAIYIECHWIQSSISN